MSGRRYIDESKTVDTDGWSRWIHPKQSDYRLSCCDCGLVHDHQFRVVDGEAEFRTRRNNRATAAVRRAAKRPRENLHTDTCDARLRPAILALLSAREIRMQKVLGQISRMVIYPDDQINRTTLVAAIHMAQAAVSPSQSGEE